MFIQFLCDKCSAKLETDASDCGREIQCVKCGARMIVPRKGVEAGTTVGGFKILRFLASGGMGQVWLARQQSLDRSVILKILPPQLSLQPEFVRRFHDEAKHLAKLNHPNIVTIYEAGEDAGVFYMVMEWVEGQSLLQRLSGGPMSPSEVLTIALKLTSALDYAWRDLQLLHRDIKPDNIVVDKRGQPKLVDFGLARIATGTAGLTMANEVFGTPNYMSPEQMEASQDIDCRADVYSLGMTLHHLVTGQIPYGKTSWAEIVRRQATEDMPDPRTIVPTLPAACCKLICTMVQRNRDARYQSWGALAADLRRVIAGKHPSQYPNTSRAPGAVKPQKNEPAAVPRPRDTGKKRTWIPLAATVGFVTLLGSSVALWKTMQASPKVTAPPPASPPSPQPPATRATPVETSVKTLPAPAATPSTPLVTSSVTTPPDKAPDTPGEPPPARPEAPRITWEQAPAELEALISSINRRPERFRENASRLRIYLTEIRTEMPATNEAQANLRRQLEDKTKLKLNEIMAVYSQAVAQTTSSLLTRAEDKVKEKDYAGARLVYQNHAEPFGLETARWREARVQQLVEREDAENRLRTLIAAVGASLARTNCTEAVQLLSAAQTSQLYAYVSNEVAGVAGFVNRVVRPEAAILGMISKQAGKSVSLEIVDVRNSPLRGRVMDVVRGEVRVSSALPEGGELVRPCRVKDLTLSEQLRWLTGNTPEASVMRALISLQHGERRRAKACFTQTALDHAVASAMAAAIDAN